MTLPSGTRLSQCVANARSDSDLQNAGTILTRAADHLSAAARAGDADAALRLGYLVGAARRGAAHTAGIHAELQRHIERAAAVLDDAGAPIAAALARRPARRGGDRMKLRLYHHPDGARVAYRETGTAPASCCCTRRCSATASSSRSSSTSTDRYRLVLPDLPLHGDSEDRPRHPYTLDWLAEVIAAFCPETARAAAARRRPRAGRADRAARARAAS